MSTVYNFNPQIDILRNILLWQYDSTRILKNLLLQKQAWYSLNIEDFFNNWVTNVFDLRTANDFGCAVWSILLNLPLWINGLPDPEGKQIFGFGADSPPPPPDNSYFNFENGSFSSLGQQIRLTLPEKRFLLQLRYFQLISRGTIPDANAFFATIFNAAGYSGTMYLVDNLNMTMTLKFSVAQEWRIKLLFENYNVLPRPSGVQLLYDYT